MNGKFALVAGLLLSSVSAGSLLAQTSATSKPGSSSMQRTPSASQTQPVRQDSTSAKASTGQMAHHHAKWTKDQVKDAQLGLTKAGFYKGKATGEYNKQTRAAIRAYQKANKLPVTGRLNDDLLTRLHSA